MNRYPAVLPLHVTHLPWYISGMEGVDASGSGWHETERRATTKTVNSSKNIFFFIKNIISFVCVSVYRKNPSMEDVEGKH